MPKRTFAEFIADLPPLFPCAEEEEIDGPVPPERPTIEIAFYVRKRRHGPYDKMCAVPTKFHKSRRGTITASNLTKNVKISIQSVPLEQKSSPNNCFVCKDISGTTYNSTFQLYAGKQVEQEFFLKIDKKEHCKQRIIIEYIYDSKRVVLEDWKIETMKSHKFESSKKGKALVFDDVSSLVLYPDVIAQPNFESFEPETKKKRLNQQTCNPVISRPLFKDLPKQEPVLFPFVDNSNFQRQEEAKVLEKNLFPFEAQIIPAEWNDDFFASLYNSAIDATFISLLGKIL